MSNRNTQKIHSLEQGAALLFLSTILAKIISAFFKIPLSSEYCLGDLGFGYFSAVHDLITPIHTLAASGLPVAVSRLTAQYIAEKRQGGAEKVFKTSKRVITAIALICGVLIFVLSYPFVLLTDKTGQTIYSLFAMIPAVICCILTSVYRGYYEGIRNMTPAAISDIVEALGKLILGFAFAYFTVRATGNPALGSAAAVIGISTGAFLSLLYLMISYRKDRGKNINKDALYDKKLAKTVVALAFPIAIASISGCVVSVIDTLTVRAQLTVTVNEFPNIISEMYSSVTKGAKAEEIPTLLYGIRSKAYTLYNLIPTLTVALGVAAVPDITVAFSEKDTAGIKRGVATVIKMAAFIALPAGIGLFSIADGVFRLLYGDTASAVIGGKLLSVFAVAAVFAGISVVLSCVLQAVDRQKNVFYNVLIGIAVKLILNLSLSNIPKVNIFGSVYGTLGCFIVIFILNLYVLLKYTGVIEGMFKALVKISVSAAICGLAAFAFSLLGDGSIIIAVSILMAFAVYILGIISLKTFKKDEIERLPCGKMLSKFVK